MMLFLCQPAFALRCGRALVDIGDYKEDVYDKCGEPDRVESHYERRGNIVNSDARLYGSRRPNGFPNSSTGVGQGFYREVEVQVEEWVYDFGRTRLRQLLRFENGRLVDVISLDKRRRRYR